MKLQSSNNVSFTSLNNPIKKFSVMSDSGNISFAELDYTKVQSAELIDELGTFFIDNFAKTSSHPAWRFCQKGHAEFNKKEYDDYKVSVFNKCIRKDLRNHNTTLLIGRDKSGKIVGAIWAKPLFLMTKLKDHKTLYIDSLAVDDKYRHLHLGALMLNKVINACRARFSKTFLVSYIESMGFYKKQGFRELKPKKKTRSKLIQVFKDERIDYPIYARFMLKHNFRK